MRRRLSSRPRPCVGHWSTGCRRCGLQRVFDLWQDCFQHFRLLASNITRAVSIFCESGIPPYHPSTFQYPAGDPHFAEAACYMSCDEGEPAVRSHAAATRRPISSAKGRRYQDRAPSAGTRIGRDASDRSPMAFNAWESGETVDFNRLIRNVPLPAMGRLLSH